MACLVKLSGNRIIFKASRHDYAEGRAVFQYPQSSSTTTIDAYFCHTQLTAAHDMHYTNVFKRENSIEKAPSYTVLMYSACPVSTFLATLLAYSQAGMLGYKLKLVYFCIVSNLMYLHKDALHLRHTKNGCILQ